EVFNGKRDLLLYSFVVPDGGLTGSDPTVPFCAGTTMTADCIPDVGQLELTAVKTYDGGTMLQPAFPGALDSWYGVLASGHKVTAMGNSDSHSAAAEAGLPRTYIKVGPSADGSMRGLSLDAVNQGILAGKTVVTNGPFVEVTVNGADVGSTVFAPNGN